MTEWKKNGELEEVLESSFKLKQALGSILPPNAVEYILKLIAKDGAHRRFLEITKEDEN